MARPAGIERVLAGCVVVLSTPYTAWWLIGDQSEAAARAPGYPPYYAWQPMRLDPFTLRAVVVMSVVGFVSATAYLLIVGLRSPSAVRWWPVAALLVAAGAMAAFCYRTMTAAVVGANIGAGMVFLFGVPILLALVGSAIGYGVNLRLQHRPWPGEPAYPPVP